MPHSFLLRRLSFTIFSAVDSFTNLLLSCESHIPSSPHSPRSPRPIRRKPPLISAPTSPTSVNPHHTPPNLPSFDSQPPLRRSRQRHHSTPSRTTPPTFNSENNVRPRLTRREFLPPSIRQQSHRHAPRQQKRVRTPSRHHNHHRHQQRLAFVDSPANNLPSMQAVNAWRRNRDTVNRLSVHHLHKQHPPVSPIALPPPVRHPPRGTLTSFLTTDDADIFHLRPIETASAKDQFLEQGIRPSRRVRFAQNVQLVC